MKNINNYDFVFKVMQLMDRCDSENDLYWRCNSEDKTIKFYINCNDFFYWACADGEDITPENIGLLEQSIIDCENIKSSDFPEQDCQYYAPLLFCARSRKLRPQGAYYKHLDKNLWELFDACGPERIVDFSNTPKPKEAKMIKYGKKSTWQKIKEIFI